MGREFVLGSSWTPAVVAEEGESVGRVLQGRAVEMERGKWTCVRDFGVRNDVGLDSEGNESEWQIEAMEG